MLPQQLLSGFLHVERITQTSPQMILYAPRNGAETLELQRNDEKLNIPLFVY